MGKSGFRIVIKAAKTQPVVPSPDEKGVTQPAYLRGSTAFQTSPALQWHKSCIRTEMAGKKFPGRIAVREALTSASKACAGRNPFK